jgi:hypothetical protein
MKKLMAWSACRARPQLRDARDGGRLLRPLRLRGDLRRAFRAARVLGPTTPSTPRFIAAWKRSTAARVRSPKMPGPVFMAAFDM